MGCAYREGTLLKESIEKYKARYRNYLETILADAIYRTRDNHDPYIQNS